MDASKSSRDGEELVPSGKNQNRPRRLMVELWPMTPRARRVRSAGTESNWTASPLALDVSALEAQQLEPAEPPIHPVTEANVPNVREPSESAVSPKCTPTHGRRRMQQTLFGSLPLQPRNATQDVPLNINEVMAHSPIERGFERAQREPVGRSSPTSQRSLEGFLDEISGCKQSVNDLTKDAATSKDKK